LLLTPLTGRTHQLRVHMAHIGHAILGASYTSPLSPHPSLSTHSS
jgi:tRNA pseudouridine32 synthase/23S rRNA pseudouridine746 synthase